MNYKNLIVYVGAIIVSFGLLFMLITTFTNNGVQIKECQALKECAMYKCYAEKVTSSYEISNNYLLRYQNCLIERGLEK